MNTKSLDKTTLKKNTINIIIYSLFFIFLIILVIVGIVFNIITIGLGVVCMRNFGKGLQPYVQRGSNKRKLQDLEMNSKNNNRNSWRIDDD